MSYNYINNKSLEIKLRSDIIPSNKTVVNIHV